jgi:tRNA A-37 threonylcarbamoyl transferase component Bud32
MSSDDHSGDLLDERYRLVRKLAEGGMGAVYLAEHKDIGGKLAVKLLRSEFAESVLFLRRFRREARANAAIRHRNIVKVFDAGVAPWGEPYMVMEYLEGESLRALIGRSGPLPLQFAVEIARQALEGLAATHEAGIIHRDLKPDNLILVYEGGENPTVKIIDFGISKFVSDPGIEITWSGIVLGTARYMSPEQAEGDGEVDHRTDLYSMGVVLYLALTGAFPHAGPGQGETLAEVLRRPPIPPSEHCAGFPDDASRFLMKALAHDPRERYQSAREMGEALAGVELEGECAARSVPALREGDLGAVVGDLGDLGETMPAGPAAQRVMLRARPAPRRQSEAREWIAAKGDRPRRPLRILAVALLIVATGLGVAALIRFGALTELSSGLAVRPVPGARAPSPSPAGPRVSEPAEPPRSRTGGVTVTMEGAPLGSLVYWDGVLVPMNPFRVERRETIVPLRVEADGYESFSIAVLPAEDQIVHVAMAPAKAASKRRTGSRRGTLLDRGAASAGKAHAMAEQQEVIARNRHELKRCYDQALRRGDVPTDEDLLVHFRLGVGANGRVGSADLTGSGVAVPSFAGCLEQEVRSWFFLPADGETVVGFSFAFTTSG